MYYEIYKQVQNKALIIVFFIIFIFAVPALC